MFSDKKSRPGMETRTNQNKISEGTHLVGDIKSKGGFRLEGTVEGNLTTPSKVVVGKTGSLKGALHCENADVEGKISGTLTVAGTLTLRATAVIEGEVFANKLAVEPGANFNATCVMGGLTKDAIEDALSASAAVAGVRTSKKDKDITVAN
ncbi:polymer-forming cytoskeletal protein [Gilvibacter sp.]|uniref:polymer-forming cytoskeletal protein n=1 Tax=Gilvibacter sp. TaxID=2729997 RepID=UPI0035BE1D15